MVLVLEPGRASGLALVGEAIGSYQYKTELLLDILTLIRAPFYEHVRKSRRSP